jgi:hypothetical protein
MLLSYWDNFDSLNQSIRKVVTLTFSSPLANFLSVSGQLKLVNFGTMVPINNGRRITVDSQG